MGFFLRLWISYSFFIIVAVPAYAIVQYELHGTPSHLVLDTLHSAGMIDKPDYARALDVDELLPTVLGLIVLPPAVAGALIIAVTAAYSASHQGVPGLIRLRANLIPKIFKSSRESRFDVYRQQAAILSARKKQHAPSKTHR